MCNVSLTSPPATLVGAVKLAAEPDPLMLSAIVFGVRVFPPLAHAAMAATATAMTAALDRRRIRSRQIT